MNLVLRLIIVLFRNIFSKRIDMFDEHVTPLRVWITDHDIFQHVTNSRYFSLTDVSIIDYMMRIGAGRKFAAKGWFPVVIYEDMVVFKMLRCPQKFQIRTKLVGWDEKHVIMTHIFERKGRKTAEGYTIARFIDMRMNKIPIGTVLKLLDETRPSPDIPPQAREVLVRAQNGYGISDPVAAAEELPRRAVGR